MKAKSIIISMNIHIAVEKYCNENNINIDEYPIIMITTKGVYLQKDYYRLFNRIFISHSKLTEYINKK